MRYLGSKARIKKELIPIITEHLNGDNEFVDAFMGGANIIDVFGINRCCKFFKTKSGKYYKVHSPYQLACEHFEEKEKI